MSNEEEQKIILDFLKWDREFSGYDEPDLILVIKTYQAGKSTQPIKQ